MDRRQALQANIFSFIVSMRSTANSACRCYAFCCKVTFTQENFLQSAF